MVDVLNVVSTWIYTKLALIVNFKWNAWKKWTSSLKSVVILSAVSLHWNCAKIFKHSDVQYTSVTPDKILNSLVYRTLFYVNICGSFKLSKNSPVFWPTLYKVTLQLVQNTKSVSMLYGTYTVSQKTVQNYYCQNFVKFPPVLIISGRNMAKKLKLCEVHSFFTSSNSCHYRVKHRMFQSVCDTKLKVVICNKLSNDLISTQ